MTVATLTYTVNNGLRSNNAAELARILALAVVDANVLSFLGCTLQSDVTAAVGTNITRTITLFFTAVGEVLWPTNAAKIYATQSLYTSQLEMLAPGVVTAAAPVIT